MKTSRARVCAMRLDVVRITHLDPSGESGRGGDGEHCCCDMKNVEIRVREGAVEYSTLVRGSSG